MGTTVRRFYSVRMADTYEVGDAEIDAVRELVNKGDDESLALADDIVTHHGRYISTDDGNIDSTNEMLDFFIEEDEDEEEDEDVDGAPTHQWEVTTPSEVYMTDDDYAARGERMTNQTVYRHYRRIGSTSPIPDGARLTTIAPLGEEFYDREETGPMFIVVAEGLDGVYHLFGDEISPNPAEPTDEQVIRAAAVAYLMGADDFDQEQLKRLADALAMDDPTSHEGETLAAYARLVGPQDEEKS